MTTRLKTDLLATEHQRQDIGRGMLEAIQTLEGTERYRPLRQLPTLIALEDSAEDAALLLLEAAELGLEMAGQ